MKISHTPARILVVGSCSIDIILNTDHIPQADETLIANSIDRYFGGKGANQAVGSARLGSSVYLISSIGMDPDGQQVIRNLSDENVNVGFVYENEEEATGSAYVTTCNGKSSIVVLPAANFELKPNHVEAAEKLFQTADLLLLQLEVPLETVEKAVQIAKKHNLKVGIYVSPAKKISKDIIDYASFLVLKSSELSAISDSDSKEEILKKYPNKLFVRDDHNSTTYYNGVEMKYFSNHHININNKMGMGDAFTSGFAFAYCHGNDTETCVKFGNEVSIKASLKPGSQTSLPRLKEMEL